MLDLIEYLARWVARPGADRLPGARRAARPPAGLGRRPRQRDHDHARPARPQPRTGTGRGAVRRSGAAKPATWRPRSRSARAATPCSPRRWSTGSSRRAPPTPRRCRRRCTRCSRPGSTRCSPGTSARSLQHASVVGQTFWEGSLAERGRRPRGAPRDARVAAGQGPGRARPPAAGSPASASTRSSTC